MKTLPLRPGLWPKRVAGSAVEPIAQASLGDVAPYALAQARKRSIGSRSLPQVAPEFQITNESSVVGYVNFMQRMVSTGIGDVKGDYATLVPLAADSAALLDEINLVLAAGSISATTLASLKSALDTISAATDAGKNNRIYAALTLVAAAPEFIAQK